MEKRIVRLAATKQQTYVDGTYENAWSQALPLPKHSCCHLCRPLFERSCNKKTFIYKEGQWRQIAASFVEMNIKISTIEINKAGYLRQIAANLVELHSYYTHQVDHGKHLFWRRKIRIPRINLQKNTYSFQSICCKWTGFTNQQKNQSLIQDLM